jgi:hypothetical protein
MASTLELYTSPYLTLAAQLYPYGSDTLATSGHLNHATNRIGLYTMAMSSISGAHTVHVFQSGELIALGHVTITDGEIARVGDARVVVVDTVTAVTELRGKGADLCTMTITIGGVPQSDCDVWITTDSAGNDVYAGTLQTNSSGQVTFLLDDGETYYLWAQKQGMNSIRGEAFEAEAD